MVSSQQKFNYPTSNKIGQVDIYHGIEVADPYRWLEDPDSEETKAWVEAQNQLTFGYLAQIPDREKIKQRVTQLWNYEKYGIPFKEGDRYFYFKNDGLQNQSVLYTLESLEATPQVLLDPNTLSEDGTVALSGLSISEDGKLMAYGLSSAGSDWVEWYVRDVETGKDFDDHLKWVKFSGASWTHDRQGFFYSRYDEPNEATKHEDVNYFQKLFYHRLGTPQSEDVLIYHRPDRKEWGLAAVLLKTDVI
jgi:prolyl oligopeptidase